MKFSDFVTLVRDHGWTLAHVRCDVPPSPEMLEAMTTAGLEVWEQYVARAERCGLLPRAAAKGVTLAK